MKKDKKVQENKIKNKEQRQYDKGQVFAKIMAGILAILMLGGTAISLVYALIFEGVTNIYEYNFRNELGKFL